MPVVVADMLQVKTTASYICGPQLWWYYTGSCEFLEQIFGYVKLIIQSLNKALQSKDGDSPTLAALHKATYGIFFFAVPHRGLDVEDMKNIMGGEGHPRTGLIHQISVDSEVLGQQLEDFKDNLDDRKVISFYETEQSRRLERVSVLLL